MRTSLPCLLLLAACGASAPASTSNSAPEPPPAAAATSLTCDTPQCLVDAFAARGTATYRVEYTTDEGDPIVYTYKVDGDAVEVVIDDSADKFSGDPGIHTQRCTSIHIEPTEGGGVLSPEGCSL